MSELEATAVSDFIFESGGRNRTWLTHGLRSDSQRRALAKVATLPLTLSLILALALTPHQARAAREGG